MASIIILKLNQLDRIRLLIEKAANKTATSEELDELMTALGSDQYEMIVEEMNHFQPSGLQDDHPVSAERWSAMAKDILQSDKEKHVTEQRRIPVYKMPVFKYAVAAAAILCAVIVYSKKHTGIDKPGTETVAEKNITIQNDAAPGGNRATLKLADGTTVLLDEAHRGHVADQGGTSITKVANGEIVYAASGKKTDNLFNTMTTPRGGQYQLTLPDGSKVWLNAASSIRYPVAFNGKERKVTIEGEAYFEIAKNVEKPFIVNTTLGTTIQVLGTHFNVNTYLDEAVMKTTLVEGSVRVIAGKNSVIIKPGQQAQSDEAGHMKIADNADLQSVMAWKNGLFSFNKANLRSVMNQLARWYDIDVVYEQNVPYQLFGGEMQRDLKLSQVMKILAKSGIHCTLQNKTLIVKP